MADKASMMKSCESQNEGGQAQAMRLDESAMMGKGCEAQEITQRGVGHGDALKEGATGSSLDAAAAKNSGGPADGKTAAASYPYSDRSLI